ncbi:MATE family efflux transporter [Breznakia pachnodae]|uniref:Probable multidrug resistance protein NorM n=1 Tax=Breznakia pachnodae TaxID=265178 RepID=A0ABU0E774_9FIRM|nr:MATE family efflux transporter [Breznakia pachnodae]MDQ0362330.1 putative MATE family efflux protein [Breznakia pachnodae]
MKSKLDKKFVKYVLLLALPVIIQQLLVNLLSIADTIMIGGLGEDAISSVTVANKFFFVFNLAIFGLANGIGIYIFQYYGANNKQSYNAVFRFGLWCCALVGVVATVYLLLFPKSVITIFLETPNIVEGALDYLYVVRYSYLPFACVMMIAVAYRIKGEPKIPMVSGFIAFVVNVILNYILIFGHFGFDAMGIKGAAIATAISRYVELFFLFYLLSNKKSDLYLFVKIKKLHIKEKLAVIKQTVPLVCNEILWSVGLSVIFMNYCYVGESYIPALTVVDNISSLVHVAFAGCATATGIIIGKDLGANHLNEARSDSKKMIKIGLIIYILGSIVIMVGSPFIPLLFSLQETNAHMAMILLIVKAAIMWTQGYAETAYYILRAGGDTTSVLAIDGLFIVFGPLLLSILASRIWNLDLLMMFILVEGVNIVKVFLSTYFYKKEHWIKNLTLAKE